MTRGVLIVAVCAAFAPAIAGADDAAEAKRHFQQGTAHYALGEFKQAAEEYEAAFRAKQDPVLLYDAAQAYRLGGNQEKALLLYHNYVVLYPNESNIAEVKEKIEKLKEAVAAAEKAKEVPPVATVRPLETAPAPTVAPAKASLDLSAPAPERPTPVYKKWWLWTAVGAVAVVAVAAVLTAVLWPAPEWANEPAFGLGVK